MKNSMLHFVTLILFSFWLGHLSAQNPESTVRAMIAATDAGDADKAVAYCTSNAIHHFPGGSLTTPEDFKKRIMNFKTGFPDIQRGIEEAMVSGNTVVVRGVVTGTNTGVFSGKSATNNKVSVTWIGIYKLNASGFIEKSWVEFDTATIQNQLKGASN